MARREIVAVVPQISETTRMAKEGEGISDRYYSARHAYSEVVHEATT